MTILFNKLSFLCKQTWHRSKVFFFFGFCFDLVAPSVYASSNMWVVESNSSFLVHQFAA
jgi:hypothetical protein